MDQAAVYVRLSEYDEGDTSPERQEAECREYAERAGLEVVRVLADLDRSGFKHGVRRPAFDSALQGLQDGEYSTLIVWKLDRLTRQGMGALGAILDRLEGTGRSIYFLRDGIGTTRPQDRILLAVLAEMARSESVNTSTRVRSSFAHARKEGRWVYGNAPWGLRLVDGRLEPDPETAPAARAVLEQVRSGASLRQTVRAMNAAGLRTARGNEWRVSTLSGWLRSPAIAGLLPEGRRTGRAWRDPETGEPVSIGEGLISEAEHRAILATMEGNVTWTDRGQRTGLRKGATTLLSGLVYCGICGGRMTVGGSTYTCRNRVEGGTCSGTSVLTARLDEYVEDAALRRLAALEPEDDALQRAAVAWKGVEAQGVAAEHQATLRALQETEARLADLEEERFLRGGFSGDLGRERYASLHGRLEAEVSALRARLGQTAVADPGSVLEALLGDPETVREAWAGASLEDRRAVLAALLDRVVVTAAERKGARFDGPRRVGLIWRGLDSSEGRR